ncbi:MAG TPA: heat-shock protein HtpX, partial [Thermoproteales archaeon]|nr:heat-shock protein HtpX [Thermoproteales archaeon]
FSGILITTGIIAKLTEEELEAIVAHEASHVKNRDPLLLYILSSIEYLSRVTVALALWRFFLFFPLLELLYVYISLTTLFFVAKFIEARADIEAALISGKPLKLANALRKIGLIRLIRETKNSSRLFYWLSWDTHPPLSFRIETLEEIGVNGPPKNIWRFAITRCLKDFSLSITS